ncbi:hypothetical protein GQ43DRAFT_184315 [Delitschia confertaspora ATCC 74209]|uniref:Uncharacterized protein n=1 Tax=Delitschia confertaspora ATCC 74209 TaxID=1513339 RepID=A0A9P4JK18_9PLEO|nr:hypothetical protein GQ43DRAFT_184315 [Delitschia confertaspora ATCC 74209]
MLSAHPLLLLLTPALATAYVYQPLPAITPIPLPSDSCQSYPGYIPSPPGFAPSLQFIVTSAEDPGAEGLYASSHVFNYQSGWSDEHLIMDLRKSRAFAKEAYRCHGGNVSTTYRQDGKSLSISRDNRNAYLTFNGGGWPLELYAHEEDGKRVEGVFLGSANQTTWGFYYERPTEDCQTLDYYQVKLLGLPLDESADMRAAADPEFRGFLRVVRFD